MSSNLIPAHRLVPGDEFLYGGTWHTVTSISGASHRRLHIRCGDEESYVADPGAHRHVQSTPALSKLEAETAS